MHSLILRTNEKRLFKTNGRKSAMTGEPTSRHHATLSPMPSTRLGLLVYLPAQMEPKGGEWSKVSRSTRPSQTRPPPIPPVSWSTIQTIVSTFPFRRLGTLSNTGPTGSVTDGQQPMISAVREQSLLAISWPQFLNSITRGKSSATRRRTVKTKWGFCCQHPSRKIALLPNRIECQLRTGKLP